MFRPGAGGATITADGTSTQVLTLRVTDANGNCVGCGGATVTITQLSGTGTIGPRGRQRRRHLYGHRTAPTTTGSGVFVATLNGDPVQNGTASQAQATVNYVPGPLDQWASRPTAARRRPAAPSP